MKLVAAAKLRRAQERILEARPYAFKMAELVGTLVRALGEDKHPLLVRREGPRKLYVVVTADKGLCGAFNSNVIRRVLELLRGSAEGTTSLLTVGRKARDYFRRRPWPLRGERLGFLDRLTFADVRELAAELTQAYLGDEVDEVWLVQSSARSPAGHRERLFHRPPGASAHQGAVASIYEPDPVTILAALLPRHVEIRSTALSSRPTPGSTARG
jgi:F-type H+-transporting ATPase subunit gamma